MFQIRIICVPLFYLTIKDKANRTAGLDRPLGFRRLMLLKFLDSRHKKVASFSSLGIGQLYPQDTTLVLFLFGSVAPKAQRN